MTRNGAKQATQTTPQIIFKQLNLNVLKRPDAGPKIPTAARSNPDNQLS